MTNYKSTMSQQGLLYHHGIKGQKWGVRRFQNADGTLTALGEKRYEKAKSSVITSYKNKMSDADENIATAKEELGLWKQMKKSDDFKEIFEDEADYKRTIDYWKNEIKTNQKEKDSYREYINSIKKGKLSDAEKMKVIEKYGKMNKEDKISTAAGLVYLAGLGYLTYRVGRSLTKPL